VSGVFYQLFQEKFESVLHNGNKYASVPTDQLVHLKETSENFKLLKEAIYKEYGWIIGEDLKL
jgi:hypothetical protein